MRPPRRSTSPTSDHLIILTPDAPTRAATAGSAPPWTAVARALRHPLAACARLRAAAAHPTLVASRTHAEVNSGRTDFFQSPRRHSSGPATSSLLVLALTPRLAVCVSCSEFSVSGRGVVGRWDSTGSSCCPLAHFTVYINTDPTPQPRTTHTKHSTQ